MEKLKMKSGDAVDGNVAKIATLFPQCVTERLNKDGKPELAIDFDKLRAELSKDVLEEGDERYQFTWPEKRAASRLANTPTDKTLRPDVDASKDFWNTKNLYIEGDNLDVLKVLRENYLGKIKMIYIDPPYNTGNDFVYNDHFEQGKEDFEATSGLFDEDGNQVLDPMQRNTESNGRFHTDWLNMIYPRLKVARDLLSDDGVIFISIDDNEQENLRKICDEVFGSQNFIGSFVVNSTPNARDYGHIGKMHEFALFYAKDIFFTETNLLPVVDKTFTYRDTKGGFNIHPLYNSNEAFHKDNRPNLYYPFYLYTNEIIEDGFYKIGFSEKESSIKIYPPKSQKNGVQFVWRWGKDKAIANLNTEIVGYKTSQGEFRIVQKMRHCEKLIRSLLSDTCYSSRRGTAEVENLFDGKIFSFPKPIKLLSDFIKVGTNENSIVLDFFSGSATTAHAVMKLNAEDGGKRKFIMVQLPEVTDEKSEARKAGYESICQIGEERIRRAGEKVKEEAGLNGKDIDVGFRVLKLDSSNMEDVFYTPEEFDEQRTLDLVDNVKSDRTPLDLLFQVMPELGIELSAKIEERDVNGKKLFFVDGTYLIATFDTEVNESTVTEIAKMKPQYFVMRDASAANDNVLDNFEQIFKHYSPDTIRKIL
ncbi:MAG: site-specific DNA-methyltransferase [Paramuribaculum sp.]|nr:site-specific DNA-methyltransferase [Paramuribaculum sp.]